MRVIGKLLIGGATLGMAALAIRARSCFSEHDVVALANRSLDREDEMFRYRETQQVIYGHFNEFIKGWQDLGAIFRKKGWPEPTVWAPTVGVGNESNR